MIQWRCEEHPESPIEAPACCTGADYGLLVDGKKRNAPIMAGQQVTDEQKDEWSMHDCAPVCCECGDDCKWIERAMREEGAR